VCLGLTRVGGRYQRLQIPSREWGVRGVTFAADLAPGRSSTDLPSKAPQPAASQSGWVELIEPFIRGS